MVPRMTTVSGLRVDIQLSVLSTEIALRHDHWTRHRNPRHELTTREFLNTPNNAPMGKFGVRATRVELSRKESEILFSSFAFAPLLETKRNVHLSRRESLRPVGKVPIETFGEELRSTHKNMSTLQTSSECGSQKILLNRTRIRPQLSATTSGVGFVSTTAARASALISCSIATAAGA